MSARPTRSTRIAAGVALAGLLGVGLTACGSGSNVAVSSASASATAKGSPTSAATGSATTEADGALASFCSAYTALDKFDLGDGKDLAAVQRASMALKDLAATMKAADAPTDIAADWTVVTGAIQDLADTAAKAVANPADSAALQELKSKVTNGGDAVNKAVPKVTAYGQAHCSS